MKVCFEEGHIVSKFMVWILLVCSSQVICGCREQPQAEAPALVPKLNFSSLLQHQEDAGAVPEYSEPQADDVAPSGDKQPKKSGASKKSAPPPEPPEEHYYFYPKMDPQVIDTHEETVPSSKYFAVITVTQLLTSPKLCHLPNRHTSALSSTVPKHAHFSAVPYCCVASGGAQNVGGH